VRVTIIVSYYDGDNEKNADGLVPRKPDNFILGYIAMFSGAQLPYFNLTSHQNKSIV